MSYNMLENNGDTIFISKESVQRLLRDVKQIMKNPLTDNGIYYTHDDSDMLKGYAMIIGPKNTPYFGGFYFFQFDFPSNYPYSPPKVTFKTNDGLTRYNPNLYKSGKVCVSILNTWTGEKWSSCQNINSVLLTLCLLLNEMPLENEPGYTRTSKEFIPYQKSIEFSNINFAICDMIHPEQNKIPNHFAPFYPIMKEHFLTNYDKIMEFVLSKQEQEITYEYISFYSMKTKINYVALREKLEETRRSCLA